MDIISSILGIGKLIAVELIIATNEFKNFSSAKKLASYCGVVPFEYSSGSSLKGKPHVSKIANSRMKSLLHMAAIASLRTQGDMSDYYKRKVAEGKHKMSVLNAIKNKLLQRVFVCVKEERLHQKVKGLGPIVPTVAKIEYP